MKCTGTRWSAYIVIFALLCGFESALKADEAKPGIVAQIHSLKLSSDELKSLEDIVIEANRTIQTARGEVNADRVELTRALLLPGVTTKDLEPIVRRSIEAEMSIRMAELDRQLKIRKLLGDSRWASLSDLAAQFKSLPPQQQASPADDLTTSRLINLLRVL
jgi:adenine specific DNA methylase Mod